MEFRFNNMMSKKMNKRKPILSDDQLYALEEHLAGTLKPVTPPMEVVQRLHERIRFPIKLTSEVAIFSRQLPA